MDEMAFRLARHQEHHSEDVFVHRWENVPANLSNGGDFVDKVFPQWIRKNKVMDNANISGWLKSKLGMLLRL
ncbi:hypothetical protein OESDEN_24717 [Oesophagostomum dentatum]|uniref:Uncharacterized protein n=1 Tax=Oesophagostomum dentatum TaxID=61180 RepID=A0A0B1RWW3_OESDE|nr:hypothetical protein OESDEN_24717 [Oesophagostomum dentatum]